jgi:hypothetical protein
MVKCTQANVPWANVPKPLGLIKEGYMEFKNITELSEILSEEEQTRAASNFTEFFTHKDVILCSSNEDGEEFLVEVDVETLK